MRKGLLIATLVSIAASLPFYGYEWNRFMHILGSILFMGNMIVTAVWFSLARRSQDAGVIRFSTRAVVLTDVVFTTPGAILLLVNGGILGTPYFKMGAPWIVVSLVLFVASGVLWAAALVPLQGRMMQLAETAPVGDEMRGLIARWFRLGGVATLLPLVTLVLMVLKPALW